MIKPEHKELLEKHMPDIIDEFSAILEKKYKVEGIKLHGLSFVYGDGGNGGAQCTKQGCGHGIGLVINGHGDDVHVHQGKA